MTQQRAEVSFHVLDRDVRTFFGLKRHWIDLIFLLVQRDLRVRYRASILGYIWSMLNPLLYMAILTLVFSHVVKLKSDSYALFILSGIMVWNLLQQSLIIGMNSIVGSGHLLKKVSIPGLLFPTASLVGVIVNFLLSFMPFIVICLFLKAWPPVTLLLVPFLLVIFVAFIWGLAVCVASLNVRYRDIGHAMEPVMQMLFYATPIVYPVDVIPEKWRFLIELNPVTHFLSAFRGVMISGTVPPWDSLFVMTILAVISCFIGYLVYRKTNESFVYYL
jgi:ABC-2 type transport system permease protein